MKLFNSFEAELQSIDSLRTQIHNRQIDLRQKLTEAGWQVIHAWDCEWYVSQDFAKYISINNLPKSKINQFFCFNLIEGDDFYGNIIYFGEE